MQIQTTLNTLLQQAQTTGTESALPLNKPDVVPKKSFKRKRNTESSRALTAYELAEQKEKEAERRQHQEDKEAQIMRQRALEDSQAGPSQGVEFLGEYYTGSDGEIRPILDVDKLEPPSAQAPLEPPPSTQPLRERTRPTSPPPAHSEPPPSTAPARLTRTGRTVKKTARKQAAQDEGLLPESQERR